MAALVAALTLPATLRAQVQTLKDFHVADVAELRTKFVGLAQAFPEDRYAWKPMEGTRSVRDVLVLVAAEGSRTCTSTWGSSSPTRA
jgi:hypothetical protein